MENKIGGTTISKYDYSVNSLGQRIGVESTGQIHGANNRGWTWGYNTSGEVNAATHQHQTTLNRAYIFDALGNRTSSTEGTGGGAQTTNYTPNSLNQYSSITLPGGSPVAPVHDLDGNLLEDKGINIHTVGKKFEWDAENRLTKVRRASENALLASYSYDPFSRRIRRTTEAAASGGAQDHLFIYDGWNLIAEYTLSSSAWTYGNRYTWGLDLSGSLQGAGGVGGLLEIKATSGLRIYPFHDGHGNITSYSDMRNGVVGHREYDPFGIVIHSSGSFPARFSFSSKPYDPETGFSYYGYRYYDAYTGRWPSRDPIGEKGGANPYAFVQNDPIQNGDFLGLRRVPFCFLREHIGDEMWGPEAEFTAVVGGSTPAVEEKVSEIIDHASRIPGAIGKIARIAKHAGPVAREGIGAVLTRLSSRDIYGRCVKRVCKCRQNRILGDKYYWEKAKAQDKFEFIYHMSDSPLNKLDYPLLDATYEELERKLSAFLHDCYLSSLGR